MTRFKWLFGRCADLERQLAERTVERDEARRDADVRRALNPGPHRHTFQWSSSTARVEDEPPAMAMCPCGIVYQQVRA